MKLLLIAVSAATASCAPMPPPIATQSPQAAVDQLLAADRAYGASADKGFVGAITQMLAPDAVMPSRAAGFSTGPEAIAAVLSASPDAASARASWAPVRAGISADGLHGFTYGFMTLRRPDKPDERIKYLSYWVKGADGWKVALFKRGRSSEGSVSTTVRAPALPTHLVAPSPAMTETHRASLIAAEKAFSDDAQRMGVGPAFAKHGSADAMNLGGEADFVHGSAAIGAAVDGPGPAEPGASIHWAADEGALVASSGDLGVTWGWIRSHKPQAGQPDKVPFFTVWRRDSLSEPWRYIAE